MNPMVAAARDGSSVHASGAVPLTALGGSLAAIATAAAVPGVTRFVSRCPVHFLTGLDCPGCGATRSVLALVDGDLARAFGHNALFVVMIPMFVAAWVAWYRSEARGRPLPAWLRSQLTMSVALAVALVFAVARNVPLPLFQPLRA